MGGGGDEIWIGLKGTPEADLELEAETQSTPCGSSHDDDLLMHSLFHASEAIAYNCSGTRLCVGGPWLDDLERPQQTSTSL